MASSTAWRGNALASTPTEIRSLAIKATDSDSSATLTYAPPAGSRPGCPSPAQPASSPARRPPPAPAP